MVEAIGLTLVVVALGLLWNVAGLRWLVMVPRATLLHLRLTGKIEEFSERPSWMSGLVRREAKKSLLDLIVLCEKAAADPRVHAVRVDVDDPHLGWSKAEQLGEVLDRLRRRGKEVVVFLESGRLIDLFLACHGDRIVLPPGGSLTLMGLAVELTFLKDTLARFGVRAEFLRFKEYKAALDALMRDDMSAAHREMLDALLDDSMATVVGHIARRRGLTEEAVRAAIDRGLLGAEEALAAGLVDELAYGHELVDDWYRLDRGAESAAGEANENEVEVGGERAASGAADGPALRPLRAERYGRIPPPLFRLWGRPRVGLVYAQGAIAMGESGRATVFGRSLGAATLTRALRRAAEDDRLRALVLRVDSPGGSALASDLLWSELRRCAARKPLLASLSDTAASGGYYLSVAAEHVTTHRTTLTGSIGVIGGKLDLSGTYEMLSAHPVALSRGRMARLFSARKGFDEEERERLRASLARTYDQFLDRVARGRKMSVDEVDRVGGGRVWTGALAIEEGLADQAGGLLAALDEARQRAGLRPHEPLRLIVLPAPVNVIREALSGGPDEQMLSAARQWIGDPQSLLPFPAGQAGAMSDVRLRLR